jgi:hypothetical protein
LLLLTFGVYMLAGDSLTELNFNRFGLSKHELDLTIDCCIVMTTLTVVLFFLILGWRSARSSSTCGM